MEWVEGSDGLTEFALGDPRCELGVEAVFLLGGSDFEPTGEPEADKTNVAEDEEAVGDFEGLSAHGAKGDERAAVGEAVGEVKRRLPADGVEGEAGAVFAAEGGDGGF